MDALYPSSYFIIPSVIFTIVFLSIALIVSDRVPSPWASVKRNALVGKKNPSDTTSLECPYNYIRQIYGTHHWAPFVQKLSPNLEVENPKKYSLVLEIMDAIHLNLMLVDDISDNSDFRKGKPAAHRIYGSSETANRAYYRVTQILNRTVQEFPTLAPWLMQNLEEILQGQDLSLVWRRDGLSNFPTIPAERVREYRRMASLKTGALFRLLGQLVCEDRSFDKTMTTVAWYSQLQNDCKNVYSSEYSKAKGALAEDLQNGELSYPIVLALDATEGQWVARALKYGSPRNIRKALRVIQSEKVREACLAELKSCGMPVRDWLAIWGRNEALDLRNGKA